MIQWTRPGAEKKKCPKAPLRTHANRVFINLISYLVRSNLSVLRKRPRRVVPSRRFERVQFFRRPSIHVCAFHRRDVHSSDRCTPEQSRHTNTQTSSTSTSGWACCNRSTACSLLTEERVEQRVALVLRRHILLVFFVFFFVSRFSSVLCESENTHTHTHTHTHTLWESRSDARFFLE